MAAWHANIIWKRPGTLKIYKVLNDQNAGLTFSCYNFSLKNEFKPHSDFRFLPLKNNWNKCFARRFTVNAPFQALLHCLLKELQGEVFWVARSGDVRRVSYFETFTSRKRTGGKPKKYATKLLENLELLAGPRAFGFCWSSSIHDVASLTPFGLMSSQAQGKWPDNVN